MVLEPIVIEGIAHPVTVTRNKLGGNVQLLVNGQPVPQRGASGEEYQLPSSDGGTATARVKVRLADPYPTILVNGNQYRTGPRPPIVMRVLALVPLLVAFAGLFGIAFGIAALVANFAILRMPTSTAARIWAIVGIDAVAVALTVVTFQATT